MVAPECGRNLETELNESPCFCKGCNMKEYSPIRIIEGRFAKESTYTGVGKIWEVKTTKESALP